ncbi:MAG: hypothetical protein WBA43_17875 [Elainellaceae cyanobacterium]
MNHVAFFTNPWLPQEKGILNFLIRSSTDVWIHDSSGEKKLESIEDIVEGSEYWHYHPWFVHGPCLNDNSLNKPLSLFSQRTPQFSMSLEIIDFELSCLSNKYEWVFFPWGGVKRFLSLGFMSNNQDLFNRVIARSSNYQRLISNYVFKHERLSHLIHSVLLGGYFQTAYPLWDICSSTENTLWVVTETSFSRGLSVHEWWSSKGYELIDSLPMPIENSDALNIYEVTTKETFKSMCHLASQMPDTLIFIPPHTDLGKLSRLLEKTENVSAFADSKYYNNSSISLKSMECNDNSYSDLFHLKHILETVEWFFGIDRDMADYGNSFFVARDNKLIRRFSESLQYQSSESRLISCF